jgi:Protein of unknown function (DUF2637)
MSGPGFARPDLCSIRASDEQDELAEVVRSGSSAAGYPLGDDDPPVSLTSGIDPAIRLSTAAAVLAVAGIAAYVSYWHAYAVVRAHGESGITARLEPATIDGLVYASSMVMLYAARHRVPVPCLARWLLGLGIAATLTANMAQGWSHGLVGAAVAAWPAIRCPNASWPRCSGARPAAGRAPGSPKYGGYRRQGESGQRHPDPGCSAGHGRSFLPCVVVGSWRLPRPGPGRCQPR